MDQRTAGEKTGGTEMKMKYKICPDCKTRVYPKNSEAITTGGVYGNERVEWGQYAGVHTTRIVGLICPCNYEIKINPQWD